MRIALRQGPAVRQLAAPQRALAARKIAPSLLQSATGVIAAPASVGGLSAGAASGASSRFQSTATAGAVGYKRTHSCGELRADHAGQEVSLCGWVHNLRQLGQGIAFLVLRDAYGIVQARASLAEGGASGLSQAAFDGIKSLRLEDIVEVRGVVVPRPPELVNRDMATGSIEVEIIGLQLLGGPAQGVALPIVVGAAASGAVAKGKGKGGSSAPPAAVAPAASSDAEAMRLTARHLDLRRWVNQRNLRLRSEVAHSIRSWLHGHRFVEVETPTLFRSTPEGAREFLVPTRHHGKAYALTQSPQQYKQLLMVGGVDRYYQLARCYRDESGRADRQPEFTQVDLEVAFPTRGGVMAVAEGVARAAWDAARRLSSSSAVHGYVASYPSAGVPPMVPWSVDAVPPPCPDAATDPLAASPVLPVVTYAHALSVYGSDKPDRRPGMPLLDVTGVWRGVLGKGSAHRDGNVAAALAASHAAASSVEPYTLPPSETDLSSLGPTVASLRCFVLRGGGAPSVFSRKEADALAAEVAARAASAGSSGTDASVSPLTVAVIRVNAAPEASSGSSSSALELSDWKGHPLCKDVTPEQRHALAVAMGLQAGDLLVLGAGIGGERLCKALGAARLLVAEVARLKGLPLTPAQHLYPSSAAPIPSLRPEDTVLFGGKAALGALSSALSAAPSSSPSEPLPPATVRPDLFWVTDFPLFEAAETAAAGAEASSETALASTHHPFTAPVPQDERLLRDAIAVLSESSASPDARRASLASILQVRGQHYDLVCNGIEVGGGSLRIHASDLQLGVLRDVLRVSAAQLDGFGPLLTALAHGAPPHGGIALGLDRLVMLLAGPASASTVRDVIAFPKSANGNELMTGSPGPATDAQLAEYHIQWRA